MGGHGKGTKRVCVCVCVCVCARARTTILAPLAVAGPPPKGQRKKRRSSLRANASQIKHVVKHKKKRALHHKNACAHIPSPHKQYCGPPTNCWLTDHCSSCGSLASPNPNPQTLFDPARSRPGPVKHHFSVKSKRYANTRLFATLYDQTADFNRRCPIRAADQTLAAAAHLVAQTTPRRSTTQLRRS